MAISLVYKCLSVPYEMQLIIIGFVKREYIMIIPGYFFLFLHKNMCCGYSLEAPRLAEALVMSTHNICFYGELEKIIPELSSNTPP